MHSEVIGVRLNGLAPFKDAEVKLTSGLHAVAGLNGVGKSRLLRGLRRALSGDPTSAAEVYFRLERSIPSESSTDSKGDPLVALVVQAVPVKDRDGFADYLTNAIAEKLSCDYSQCTEAEVARAIAGQLTFAFLRHHDGTIHLYAAMDPRTEDQALRQACAEFTAQWEAEVPDAGEDPEHFHECFYPEMFTDISFEVEPSQPCPLESRALPTAVVELGLINSSEWPLVASDLDDTRDLDRTTCELLSRSVLDDDQVVEVLTAEVKHLDLGAGIVVPESLHAWAAFLSEKADANFQELFPGAPTLRCHVRPVHRWLVEQAVTWVAVIGPELTVQIADLGQAHRRWATWSINATIARARGAYTWLIVDEPETAVHRSAERTLSRAFGSIVRESRLRAIAATHSPDVLQIADRIDVVRQIDGLSMLEPVDPALEALIADVGLTPSDLLGWYRTFVLVEGAHDEVVVERIVGDDLARARAKVIRMSGIRESSGVVDSQLFTRFSDGDIVLLVDGLMNTSQHDWDECIDVAAKGDTQRARRLLQDRFPDDQSYEARFVRDAGTYLLDRGQSRRLRIVTLGVPDIIDLLPVSAFTDDVQSWTEARAHVGNPRSGLEFKKRFARKFGVPISVKTIERAIGTLQIIPAPLADLVSSVQTDQPLELR